MKFPRLIQCTCLPRSVPAGYVGAIRNRAFLPLAAFNRSEMAPPIRSNFVLAAEFQSRGRERKTRRAPERRESALREENSHEPPADSELVWAFPGPSLRSTLCALKLILKQIRNAVCLTEIHGNFESVQVRAPLFKFPSLPLRARPTRVFQSGKNEGKHVCFCLQWKASTTRVDYASVSFAFLEKDGRRDPIPSLLPGPL